MTPPLHPSLPADLPRPASGRFVEGVHFFPVRVYFEDTDTGGVVYHANYLRYMERARSDMLRLAGIDQRGALESGAGVYAVAHVDIRYQASGKLDDDLLVVSRVEEVGAATCIIAQEVRRGDATLSRASVKVAFISPEGRPRRQPRDWVATFQRLALGEPLPS
jgi:acyl-CoA thioester hydrolase